MLRQHARQVRMLDLRDQNPAITSVASNHGFSPRERTDNLARSKSFEKTLVNACGRAYSQRRVRLQQGTPRQLSF
jgi:hypothetical protein